MSTLNRPTSRDIEKNSLQAMNATRVAVSQAKAGITKQLLTHRKEVEQVKEMQEDVSYSQDKIDSYTDPYLRSSGEYLSSQSRTDENDQFQGNNYDAVSGTKQIGGSKVRIESFQEVVLKAPLALTSASSIVSYGIYKHDITDISQSSHHHMWLRCIDSMTLLSDSKHTYVSGWDVETCANQRSAVGNRRLYSDFLSVQIGQEKDPLHPEKTALEGAYGDLSLLIEGSNSILLKKGDLKTETKKGNISVKSAKDSTYYSKSNLTIESINSTYVNGNIVMINTSTQGEPGSPEPLEESYSNISDLPEYKHKKTGKQVAQAHYTDRKGKPFLQDPPSGKAGGSVVRRSVSYD